MTKDKKTQQGLGNGGLVGVFIVGLIAAGYVIYATTGSDIKPQIGLKPVKPAFDVSASAPKSKLAKLATGDLKSMIVHASRKQVPDYAFKDAKGNDRTISQWKGKVVLLNLWATWCGPCRKEMPHLSELQEKLGGDGFEVVAVSVDRKGVEASKKFLVEAKAEKLALYADQSTKIMGKVRAPGLPVTVLIDKKGREAARLIGPAVWNGADALAFIKELMAEE